MFHDGKSHSTHHLAKAKAKCPMTDDFVFQVIVNFSTSLFAKGKGNFPEFHLNESCLQEQLFRGKK